jgi:hypothetical protein
LWEAIDAQKKLLSELRESIAESKHLCALLKELKNDASEEEQHASWLRARDGENGEG